MYTKMEYERLILSKYVGHIKRVGGRGPKNIYVKIENSVITINFSLTYSPIEKFVCENLEDSSFLLTDIYVRVGKIVVYQFIDELSQEIKQPIDYVDHVIDIDNNKFQLVLKCQSSFC